MEYYRKERENERRMSNVIGICVTVCLHVLVFVLAYFKVFGAMSYLYPPPEEQSMLIEFVQEEQDPLRARTGREPQALEVDPTNPMNLVQASEAQFEGRTSNLAAESTIGPDGDVEVPEPPREKEIDRRALFHAADNKAEKDTLAAQVADKVSEGLKEGHAQGNTKVGKTDGTPNARLQGRNVLGTLPSPAYGIQAEGTIVVEILVDQYGNVQKATAGVEGTTLTDASLWAACRKAAMGAHFSMKADAPAVQKGTITYNFRLK